MRQYKNRYQLTYISRKDGKEHQCFPYGEDKKEEQLRACYERGIKVVSCKKMYPINMEKHQHDFCHLSNMCWCAIYDMQDGTVPADADKMEKLEERAHRADEYAGRYGVFGQIGWFTWEEYKDAKEMIADSINARMAACEEAGVPYVAY